MKLCLALTALVLTLGIAQGEWVLEWSDEFDGGNLADRWNFEGGCDAYGNNELECYTNNRPENARQENGKLIIQARREWWDEGGEPQPFTSARMTTKGNWRHGKYEIRARMPKGKHLWPAIWMMPASSVYGDWPRSGEMDITEYRGQRPNQILGTLHFGPSRENKGQIGTGERNFDTDFSQDFHTFGYDWSPTQIQWILDDVVYHTESVERNFWEGFYTANGQPFDQPFFLILNLAVGGMFFGDEPFDPVEADQWEKPTFEIEFVKKWRWQ